MDLDLHEAQTEVVVKCKLFRDASGFGIGFGHKSSGGATSAPALCVAVVRPNTPADLHPEFCIGAQVIAINNKSVARVPILVRPNGVHLLHAQRLVSSLCSFGMEKSAC